MRLRAWFPTCSAAGLIAVTCTVTPTIGPDSDTPKQSIDLSVQQKGIRTAVYSGLPIKAIVELSDSAHFGNLAWHIGNANYTVPDQYVRKTGKYFEVYLSWRVKPTRKDTVTDCYYDTAYVSVGGNVKVSNVVRIDVTNLPVLIDSIIVGKMVLTGLDGSMSYGFSGTDTTSQIPLKVYARDLDGPPPLLGWSGDKGRIRQPVLTSPQLIYTCPVGDFRDTVVLMAYDGDGGQASKIVYLSRVTPNSRPLIDSVMAGTQRVSGPATYYRFAFIAFDTLRLRVWAHDLDKGDLISYLWSAKRAAQLFPDSVYRNNAMYTCSTCEDTLKKDTAIVIDTITVKVFDKAGDTTYKYIELLKGKLNNYPEIDSIVFGKTTFKGKDTLFQIVAAAPNNYTVAAYARDIDTQDNLNLTWTSRPVGKITRQPDLTWLYTAKAALGNDTLKLVVSDGKNSVEKRIVVVIDDLQPVLDSIVVKDSIFKSSSNIYNYQVPLGDTLRFTCFARDFDVKDTMRFLWSAKDTARFVSRLGNKLIYLCPATPVLDTVVISVVDGVAAITKKIAITVRSYPPVVDSIVVNKVRLLIPDSLYLHSSNALDTCKIQLYVRDLDLVDRVNYTWSAADSAMLKVQTPATNAIYFCRDSTYVDTIQIFLQDMYQNKVRKYVLISVKK